MTSLDQLLEQARAAVAAMTPDQLAHMRHEQRISFAFGNVALSMLEVDEAALRESVRLAAGPCPCGPCDKLASDK